jgi:hypothetical protein
MTIELYLLFSNNRLTIIDIVVNTFVYTFVYIKQKYYKSIIHYFIHYIFIRKPKFKKGQSVIHRYGYPNLDKERKGIISNISINNSTCFYVLNIYDDNLIMEENLELSLYQQRNDTIDDIIG